MSDTRLVFGTLLRLYRWITLGFVVAIVLATVVGDVLLSRLAASYPLWTTIAANGAKYWLSVIGVLLVSVHLRPMVAAGLTRRAFLRGAGLFLTAAAVTLSVLVTAGHAVEQAIVRPGHSYPAFTAAAAAPDLAHTLVTVLAYAVTGAVITAGYYRCGPWPGFLLMIPATVPVLLAEALLGIEPYGRTVARVLPYGLALAATLVAAVLVAVMGQRELRDVAIRRAAG
jgi:hypothetical protein